jgi:uncharacterized membrane protein YcaP (DUF421 family)
VQTVDQLLNFDPVSLALIVVRTVAVYLVLFIAIRAAGKREIGQMTPFDLVVLLVISNAVQNAMIGPDTSLTGGLLAALCLLFINHVVARLGLKSRWLQEQLVGHAAVLVSDGRLMDENLQREGVSADEVTQALREHGVDELKTVELAVLEVDGTISVVPTDLHITRTRHPATDPPTEQANRLDWQTDNEA